MSKVVEKATKIALGVSLFAEAEKIAGGPLRYHLPEPLNWPLIYTSDIAPAIAAGLACGWLGKNLARFTRPLAQWSSAGNESYARRYQAVSGFMLAGLISLYPVKLGINIEMKPSIYCDHDAEAKKVFSCKPDPIDAATVVLGTELGVLSVLIRRKNESETEALPTSPF